MESQTNPSNGISISVIGLILGIISNVGGAIIFFICTGWASFEGGLRDAILLASCWTLLSALSFFLTLTGRKRMVRSGKSGVLGIIGMIIGILAILFSIGIIAASCIANNSI